MAEATELKNALKRDRVGRFAGQQVEEKNYITNLEYLDLQPDQTKVGEQKAKVAVSKLDEAREHYVKMQSELRTISSGIIAKYQEIGQMVADAYQFQGYEKFIMMFGEWGKNKAHQRRLERINGLNVVDLVKQINEWAVETIKTFGVREQDNLADEFAFNMELDKQLKKLKQGQVELRKIKQEKEDLVTEIKTIELELGAGVVDEVVRAEKEKERDDLQRKINEILRQEIDALGVVAVAQRSIPELTKTRDAAANSVMAIRQMRRDLLENQENFREILERSPTAVKDQAVVESYKSIDPALKKTISMVVEHRIKVAGGLVETALERINKAAIDPKKSNELAVELIGTIQKLLDGVAKLEHEAKEGLPPFEDDSQGQRPAMPIPSNDGEK